MLCLRLTRGSGPGVLLRRLLLAVVSAGTCFLLLTTLGYALGNPGKAGAASVRLLWCLVPAAAAVRLAVAVACVEPPGGPTAQAAAADRGPSKTVRTAAATTVLSCSLGSAAALAVFLLLRGEPTVPPLPPGTAAALGAGVPLPLAGTLTLLAFVPLLSAVATMAALRPRGTGPPRSSAGEPSSTPAAKPPTVNPGGLFRGAALVCAGLALELYTRRWQPPPPGDQVTLPGGLPRLSTMMIIGWSLTAAGFVLAGPGLVYLCGRMTAAAKPGALRLLAGRGLLAEAHRLGKPLGVLCAAASATLAAVRLWRASGQPAPGPLALLGSGLVIVCAVATVLTAAEAAREARSPVSDTLVRLGAPSRMLRRVVLVRTGVLMALLMPLTWAVAELAALPMYS